MPCADFVVCSLCILYLNSSSSRGLQILWITWFSHAAINTCVPKNAVCPGPFLLLRKVHNFKVADRSVDKCRVVRVSSTALRTGRLWAEGGVPLCAAERIQGKNQRKTLEKKEKNPRRFQQRGLGAQQQPGYNAVTKRLPNCHSHSHTHRTGAMHAGCIPGGTPLKNAARSATAQSFRRGWVS